MNQSTSSPRFYGWTIACICLFVYFFTNGMSIFVPQNLFPRFMETFSATEGQVSISTALMFGLTAILAPFGGALVDRFGPIVIIRIGIAVMAACFSLYPFAQSLQQLYLLHAGLAFGLVLGGLLVNVVILSNWFVRRRGLVVGLLTSMSSVGGLILPNAISPLVNDPELGWRWGFGALTIAFWLLAVIPAFTLLKARPSDVGQWPDGDAQPPSPSEADTTSLEGVSFGDALKTRTLYVLAIGSACLWFTFQAVNSQVQIFLELEAGLDPVSATRLYSTIFGFSILGKFAFGALSDHFPKRRVMIWSSTLLLCGCLTLFVINDGQIGLASGLVQLTAFTILFGLGYGGSFTMIQLVCVETFGPRALGKLLGFIIAIDSIGGGLGTYLTGQLKTETGSYLVPFGIVVVVAFAGLLNVLFIRPVHRA